MKQRTKGLIMFIFLGGIMVTSGVLVALPGIIPSELQSTQQTVTGTPADNFPDAQRVQFCSTGDAQSGRYITEYKIPTACTQPLAIKVDPQGTVWFAQTNTGNIASFEPSSKVFTEFENDAWPKSARSMIWGMDYSPDNSMWYTDDAYDTLWKFSIMDEEYSRIAYADGDAFPQKIQVDGSSLVINDFSGARISFIEQAVQKGIPAQFISIPSPLQESFASDFALDGGYVWYANWIHKGEGALVRFDRDKYENDAMKNNTLDVYIKTIDLPEKIQTPNGVTIGPQGHVWIADTSSSSLYRFDKQTDTFTEYVTLPPPLSSYGNATGLILDPISRPYWIETDGEILVFNEQTGNRIGVLYPAESKLIEYLIPSTNPNWGDCGVAFNCGLAQAFGFDIYGDKVWFTEWVENNIGVLDLSKKLPLDVKFDSKTLEIKNNESNNIQLSISPLGDTAEVVKISYNVPVDGIIMTFDEKPFPVDELVTANVKVFVNEMVPKGTYKVIIGVDTGDVAISEYIDIIVRS
ncbi:MAG: lyase [Cenarchaeum symbiont of Oopsacas minuta]|nr:lyase [Cenarchaeum symbiont of Oopsacas minuta]